MRYKWSDDALREAFTWLSNAGGGYKEFCAKYNVKRNYFYALRARYLSLGENLPARVEAKKSKHRFIDVTPIEIDQPIYIIRCMRSELNQILGSLK